MIFTISSISPADLNTGIVLWFQQFYALLIKRFLHSLRNWRAIITQIIIPIVFVTFGLVLIETVPGLTSQDAKRSLSMPKSALLEDKIITFYAELGSSSNAIFKVSYLTCNGIIIIIITHRVIGQLSIGMLLGQHNWVIFHNEFGH